MAYRKDWGNSPQIGGQGFARTVKTIGRAVTISAADSVSTNTVGAFTVPAGFTVTSIIVISTALGSIAFTIGDSGSANRYLTTGVQSATNVTLATAGLLYKNTTETEVLITIGTGAATAGTITVYITGFIDN